MLPPYFLYIAEASISMAVFALAYRLFFYRLTHFGWNRAYLLASLLLSLLIPLLPLPSLLPQSSLAALPAADLGWLRLEGLNLSSAGGGIPAAAGENQAAPTGSTLALLGSGLLLLYLLGCLYKSWRLFSHLPAVYRLIRQYSHVKQGHYILIHTRQNLPPFSFLRYIFLPADGPALSAEEARLVLRHEQYHLDHYHSLDLLLLEIASIVFWFHPGIYYLGAKLREVHEYQVDAALSGAGTTTRTYGELLLKLASQRNSSPLIHTFSSRELLHRIQMLTQPPSTPMQKFKFLAALPALGLALMLSSFLEKEAPTPAQPAPTFPQQQAAPLSEPVVIKSIHWSGNTVYTEARLNGVLGLKPGDPYTRAELEAKLNYTPTATDLSSLYMDQGYLYFSIEIDDTDVSNNAVDLKFTLQEGPQLHISEVRISGNTKRSSAELLKKIDIKAGELFSRAKLIKGQQALALTGYINPETIQITPIPNPEAGTVAIEFTVEEY
jgi:hypothetical protein